jgi:transposase
MISRRKSRRYDATFKKEAVSLALSSEKSVAQIADDLGVLERQLYRWIKLSEKQGRSEAFPSTGRRNAANEENARLRKEIADLRLERDILKKAVAIFSRTPV